MKSRVVFSFVALALCSASLSGAESWRPLFNGSFDGWRHWLGKPHESFTVEGLKRDEAGKYLEPIGWDKDPLGVFKIETVDGGPALHFSGQGFGVLTTKENFSNYHLRLQFKWGEKRWAPRAAAVRDSGLLYHVRGENGASSGVWPASVEMQIQEHDVGDLYSILSQNTVKARRETGANNRTLYTYDPAGEPILFEQKAPIGNRCIKGADFEKPTGEWNTVEIVCLGEDSIHIVNGKVVMRLRGARQQDSSGAWVPLTAGQISLQTEGAEVFYRAIEIRPITAVPAEFAEK